MAKIKEIKAREIKDSRGNPAVEVELKTERGSFVTSCPSGASTGKNEAVALPVEQAIENVNKIIGPKLIGENPAEQGEIDGLMIKLDGTSNKSNLGANAILSVSMAICRADATAEKLPLYQYISNLTKVGTSLKMPFASFHFIEGGVHATNNLNFREFMVVPQGKLFSNNLILANKIFNNLKEILIKNYGGNLKFGDEGGFAPPISKTEQALYILKNAIGDNQNVKMAIDCAASQFYKGGKYFLDGREFSRQELVEFYKDLVSRFEIISVKEPFSEDDWQGFKDIKKELPETIIVGNDLTTTNIKRIKEAHNKDCCNGVIIKPDQIGTVTETMEIVNLAKSYGWKIIVSHQSGETMDSFISDLAVGVGADFIKFGSPSQPERMVKYSRLLEIETELIKK